MTREFFRGQRANDYSKQQSGDELYGGSTEVLIFNVTSLIISAGIRVNKCVSKLSLLHRRLLGNVSAYEKLVLDCSCRVRLCMVKEVGTQ